MFKRHRFLISLALCLLCGIVVNISVAWWLSVRDAFTTGLITMERLNVSPKDQPVREKGFDINFKTARGLRLLRISERATSRGTLDHQIGSRTFDEVIHASTLSNLIDNGECAIWQGRASGWPMLSLSSFAFVPRGETLARSRWQFPDLPIHGSLIRSLDAKAVPLLPIPLGFAVYSFVFALAFAFIQLLFAFIRRIKRHRTGHCKSCGYSLAGLPPNTPCPECNALRTAAHAQPSPEGATH